jgi:hypothetical protein
MHRCCQQCIRDPMRGNQGRRGVAQARQTKDMCLCLVVSQGTISTQQLLHQCLTARPTYHETQGALIHFVLARQLGCMAKHSTMQDDQSSCSRIGCPEHIIHLVRVCCSTCASAAWKGSSWAHLLTLRCELRPPACYPLHEYWASTLDVMLNGTRPTCRPDNLPRGHRAS